MLVVIVILMGAGCRYPASGGDEINQSEPRALLLLCPPPKVSHLGPAQTPLTINPQNRSHTNVDKAPRLSC